MVYTVEINMNIYCMMIRKMNEVIELYEKINCDINDWSNQYKEPLLWKTTTWNINYIFYFSYIIKFLNIRFYMIYALSKIQSFKILLKFEKMISIKLHAISTLCLIKCFVVYSLIQTLRSFPEQLGQIQKQQSSMTLTKVVKQLK